MWTMNMGTLGVCKATHRTEEKWSGETGVNIHSLPATDWPQGTQSLVEDTSLNENRLWDIRSGLVDSIQRVRGSMQWLSTEQVSPQGETPYW